MNNTYIAHFGIKGMRWGVRRYQNPDGTLTEEGKRHVKNYNTANELHKKALDESAKLIRSDERLYSDFADEFRDTDFTELIADSYGIDTSALSEANSNYYGFLKKK